MDTVRVHMLGSLRVSCREGAEEVVFTPAAQDLLAYLMLHRERLQPRDHILGVFWPELEQKRARACLNSTLWRLRRALGEAGGLVTSTVAGLGIDGALLVWLDLAELEDSLSFAARRPFHAWSPSEAEQVSKALGLYRGELLEGCYADWALGERERIRGVYLGGLDELMRYYGYHAEYDQAEVCALRVLGFDPIREETHRFLMRLYEETGQRTQALRQYRTCVDALARTLDVAPMQETRQLHLRLAQSFGATTRPGPSPEGGMQETLSLLRRALDQFDQASEQLERAVQAVKRSAHRG